jgi:hypothetical protein
MYHWAAEKPELSLVWLLILWEYHFRFAAHSTGTSFRLLDEPTLSAARTITHPITLFIVSFAAFIICVYSRVALRTAKTATFMVTEINFQEISLIKLASDYHSKMYKTTNSKNIPVCWTVWTTLHAAAIGGTVETQFVKGKQPAIGMIPSLNGRHAPLSDASFPFTAQEHTRKFTISNHISTKAHSLLCSISGGLWALEELAMCSKPSRGKWWGRPQICTCNLWINSHSFEFPLSTEVKYNRVKKQIYWKTCLLVVGLMGEKFSLTESDSMQLT